MNKKEEQFPSELRYDIISGEWVVIASGRAKRPEMFKKEILPEEQNEEECPFCDYENIKGALTVLQEGEKKENVSPEWTTVSIPNKFPAFIPGEKDAKKGGIYNKMNAVGYHEVVITKDHQKSLGMLSKDKVAEVFKVYKERYLKLKEKKDVKYVNIFHNHGKEAGASIAHPHSQIITTPVIDTEIKRAMKRAEKYYQENEECLFCVINKEEEKEQKRIVYENDLFLAVCPFSSKAAFQVVISPKNHSAYFEKITEEEIVSLADAFREVLANLYNSLGNPSYNFYLHTAPVSKKDYNYYHWHWTIIPKTSIWGGFELGARMEISTIEPEKAAEYLRGELLE